MHCTTLGIEVAKQVFQLHGVDERGHVVAQKRVSRSKLRETVAQLPPCLIGVEACSSAQYWAREFQKLGHTVKLISPQKERTALVNQIRGLLAERGIVIAQGTTRLRKQLPIIMEDLGNELPPLSREVMRELYEQLVVLDERVTRADHLVRRVFNENPQCQKLAQSEGIGPVVATALVAAVGDARVFTNGRHLAAWLGVVPRQHSTEGKERLLGSSKRGARYLRTVLIHGARATGHRARGKTDARSRWIMSLEQRRGKNIATVAIANKNARIAWALLTHDAEYRKAA